MPNHSLEARIAALEARNRRVENDKSWEISWTRRIAIMVLTYLTIVAYLHFVVKIDPWLNALVPVTGFFLSGLTISYLKNNWLRRRRKK
jgi:hypothetical protein